MEHSLAVIEDTVSYRESLLEYLAAQPEFTCVLVAGSVEEFLATLASAPAPPTLILCDIGLPGITGLDGLPKILARLPHVQVLMLSVYTDSERVFAALCAGAVGYVVKSTPFPYLRDHLLQAAAGGSPLSPSVARHIVQYFKPVPPPAGEALSKELKRRGFTMTAPITCHNIMQTAGLVNDHLLGCPRHAECRRLARD